MEIRPEPIRASRRVPMQLLVAAVLLALAAVAVGASLMAPGGLTTSPRLAAQAEGAGASASPAASPAASAEPDRGPAWNGWLPPGQLKKLLPGAAGGAGNRGIGNGGFLPGITITAINGAKISLESANGWSRTIDTTGVTIMRAGATITVGDLKVGDRIAVSETRGSNGSYTVNKLTVVLDQVAGTISKIDATTITVTLNGNKTATVKTDSTTVYRQAGQAISRSDLAAGQRVVAAGTTASDGSLLAQAVNVQPALVYGTVTKKSGSTLTISTVGGGTATVRVNSKTTYQVAGKSSPTLADVAVGDGIVAQGVLGKDGSLTATAVRVGNGKFLRPSDRGNGKSGPKLASPAPVSGGTSS